MSNAGKTYVSSDVAQGKTGAFDKIRKHLAQRQAGLTWKDAWALRLSDLSGNNRLPRGFNARKFGRA